MRSSSEKDFDLGNLCIAAARARLVLARQRQIMVDMVRDYSGPYWGAEWESGRNTQPINLIGLYVAITLRGLISKNPRAMLGTFSPEASSVVSTLEDWFNTHVDKIDLAKTLKRTYLDMMFTMGIVKTGLCTPLDAAMAGWGVQAGEPFTERIDFDDYVYDIHARDISESWQAHRIRVPLDLAKKFYGKKAKDLEESEDRLFNMEGDERISVLGRGMYGDNNEYRPMVDLWEFWLPWEGVTVVVRDEFLGGSSHGIATNRMGEFKAQALKVQPWIGPPKGPFRTKSFITINGNAMGKGPVQDLWDLHNAVNNIGRKQIEQARRQKEVIFVQGGADADGNRLLATSDGEAARCDNPQSIVATKWGGPNNENYVLMNDLIQRCSWIGGNFEVRGGLSPQGKTATQENILNQNSAGTDADMQSIAADFAAEIMHDICWWHYHHPHNTMAAPWSPKGHPELKVQRLLTPQQRQQIPWETLHLKVDPYSMGHQNPQQRMATLNQVLQMMAPFAPLAAQVGRQLDFNALLAKIGKYTDDPDLEAIWGTQAVAPEGADMGQGGGPQETTHVRKNEPGRTMQGDQMNLRNALLGVNQGGQHSNGKPKMVGA